MFLTTHAPFYRGRRHGAGHLAGNPPGLGSGRGQGLWRRRAINWLEVMAGEKAFNDTGEWLPEATLDAIRDYRVAIKGPLTTPVGGGIRSVNVQLRQVLDLYACVRPVRYIAGIPSPMKARKMWTWWSSGKTPKTFTSATNGKPNPPWPRS